MHVLISVLIVIVCGVISIYGGVRCGFLLGSRVRTHFMFWCISAAIFCAGVLVSSVAIAFQSLALTVFALGALVGLLVGCKFGYGKNPGIWGMHDRFFLKSDGATDKPEPAEVNRNNRASYRKKSGVTSRALSGTSRPTTDKTNDTSAQELMSVDGRYKQAYHASQHSSEQES